MEYNIPLQIIIPYIQMYKKVDRYEALLSIDFILYRHVYYFIILIFLNVKYYSIAIMVLL